MEIFEDSGIKERFIDKGQEFVIASNPKMFKILSRSLYSNPIKTVIREIVANGYDSHVDAGNITTPVDVKLPNYLDDTFYVRDYGTGMSKEKLTTLYRTYGASDKTKSNDKVGCLGLGSKSPLAYSDTFTVESFYNGKKYTYAVFFNEEAIPELSELEEEQDTTEPNGVKIAMPTESKDSYLFEREAMEAFRHMKVKPNMIGRSPFVYPTVTNVIEVPDKFEVMKGGVSCLIMGGISYPLPSYTIFGLSVQIYAQIGDVGVTASREALEMNKRTVKYLDDKREEIKQAIADYVEDKVKNAKTYWEACHNFYNLGITLDSTVKAQYNGKDLVKEFPIDFAKYEIKVHRFGRRSKLVTEERRFIRVYDDIFKGMHIEDNFAPSKIKFHLENTQKPLYTVIFKVPTAKKDFEDEFGINPDTFPLMSSLPKAPPNPSGWKGTLKKYHFSSTTYPSFNKGNLRDYNYSGEEGYYVLINDNQVEGIGHNDMCIGLKFLQKEKVPNLFCIPRSNRNKIIKGLSEDVDDFKKYIEDKKKILEDAKMIERVKNKKYFDSNSHCFFKKIDPKLDDNITDVLAIMKSITPSENLEIACHFYTGQVDTPKPIVEFNKKHPLVKSLIDSRGTLDSDEIKIAEILIQHTNKELENVS